MRKPARFAGLTAPPFLLAFFGGCPVVYAIGRVVGRALFDLDGVGRSVFAVGGIFSSSSNVLLKTARGVLPNPIFASILLGTAVGFTRLPLPGFFDRTTAPGALTAPVVLALTGAPVK